MKGAYVYLGKNYVISNLDYFSKYYLVKRSKMIGSNADNTLRPIFSK